MSIKKHQIPILVVNAIVLLIFTIIFTRLGNYEFLFYIGVMVFFFIVILATNHRVNYPNTILWGLTLWAIMHMAGGGLFINGTRLYEIILIPLSDKYGIFKYDQLVHIYGFGVATLVMHHVLKPLLKNEIKKGAAFFIIVIMAGLGVGALNEIIEFFATVIVPDTGVGGYINTSLDLVADLIGAGGAALFVWVKKM
jgi:uncharacterized membrane protein YjdF